MAEGENQQPAPLQGQPGAIINPGGSVPPAPAPMPPAPAANPEPPQRDTTYTGYGDEATSAVADEPLVSWTASEYIEHDKSANWYILLGLAALVVAVGIFFLNGHDYFSAVVVLLAAVVLGFYSARKPREQQYQLGAEGIQIGGRYFSFHEFRSFSVVPEGAFSSIVFMPLKRFMPPLSIYYAPDDEERIVSVLATALPVSNHGNDPIDRLTRRLRF